MLLFKLKQYFGYVVVGYFHDETEEKYNNNKSGKCVFVFMDRISCDSSEENGKP